MSILNEQAKQIYYYLGITAIEIHSLFANEVQLSKQNLKFQAALKQDFPDLYYYMKDVEEGKIQYGK
jgi:hypothetical protein